MLLRFIAFSLLLLTSSAGLFLTPFYCAEANPLTNALLQITPREEVVYFNTKTHKFHNPSCRWARQCTVNCISIPKSEAIQRGGIPCKVCGG